MALGQSGGGGAPTGERVSFTLSETAKAKSNPAAVGPAAAQGGQNITLWIIIWLVGLIVLFFIGYYFVPMIFPPPSAPKTHAPSAPVSLPAPSTEPVFLGHESFFRSPTDDKVAVSLIGGTGADVRDRYKEDLLAAILSAQANSEFLEVTITKPDGHPPAWTELLTALEAPMLENSVWTNTFTRDFTAYAYYDGQNAWPGYVLKLQENQSPLTARSAVAILEKNEDFQKLFMVSPGAAGPFHDTLISGQSVRAADFASSSATFVYGWFYSKYLVLSTSPDGLREALAHL